MVTYIFIMSFYWAFLRLLALIIIFAAAYNYATIILRETLQLQQT